MDPEPKTPDSSHEASPARGAVEDSSLAKIMRVASAVADGKATDWSVIERSSGRPRQRAELRELQHIEKIAQHCRAIQEEAGVDPDLGGVITTSLPDILAGIRRRASFPQFTPDELIGNRYRVKGLLGRGGMGAVYEAWDGELSIPVALKTLRLDPGRERDALRQLKQEALLARAVVHPNICRVYDLACHGEREGGIWFMTMEVLRGETLAERLRRRGRLPPDEAWPLVAQMAAGLDAAHQSGVVHLDFKSSNVMLVEDGGQNQAVITDFGLARTTRPIAGDGSAGSAGSGPIAGTAAYIAPEQVRGEVAGPAADIYALGIVLYEMVTGTLPFLGGTALDVARRRLTEAAPSPRAIVSDVDERWEAIILRCLDGEPRRRFERADDVAAALAGRLPPDARDRSVSLPAARHTLPPERDRFVGRDPELAALHHTLAGGARLVTLLGAGGMGKTRLAVRYGWQHLEDWPGGVWVCDLTQARDVDGIVSAVAQSLAVPLGTGDPVEQLGHAIAGREKCLVILDNAEQVAEMVVDTVERWLERAPLAAFLVTSRERLGPPQEAVLSVEPMGIEPGLDLFVERAKRLRPGLEMSESDLALAREVVRLVEGIPLAIELAAARMRVMDAGHLVAGMRKRFSLLTGGPSERHATLAAAIEGSWELLEPWGRAALAQCSVFEGGFTLEAAESVLDLAAYTDAPWTVDVVQSLIDKSLLRTWVPEKGVSLRLPEPRFGMYVSLQEYARAKLMQDENAASAWRAAEERHGRWYRRLGASESMDALNEHGGLERRQALGLELENLLAASRRAVARGDGATGTAAYRAAWEVISMRGSYGVVLELGKELLAKALVDGDRALALMTLGQAEMDSGRLEEANGHFKAALAIHRERHDRRLEGVTLATLGTVARIQGQTEEASAHYEAALAIHREVGDRHHESVVLRDLGGLDHERGGRIEEARGHYEAALAIMRERGNRRWEALLLGNVGNLCHQQGRTEEARGYFERALAIHREVGDRRSEGVLLGNLGLLDYLEGRREEGRSHVEAALVIHREVGNRRSEGVNLGRLGHYFDEAGQIEEALACYEASRVIHRELGDQRWEGVALGNLGNLYHQQGRIPEAREALTQGEALLRAVKTLIELPKVLCVRAELEHGVGDVALARDLLHEAEALAAQTGVVPNSQLGRMLAKLRSIVT